MKTGDKELAKLADLAAESNIVKAVHAMPGGSSFVRHVQAQTALYWATHNDDAGYHAWLQDRWAGAQAAWASDVATTVTGAAAERAKAEAPSPRAIREAGEALKRCDERDEPLEDRHLRVLFAAVFALRGPFMQFLNAQMASLRPGEDPNERLRPHRDKLRRLWRQDVDAVVKEAGG